MSETKTEHEVEPGSHWSKWLDRAPIIAFIGVLIYAFPLWLNAGRNGWFYNDEWDFLSTREAGDFGDLMRPHNGHWTTLPILTYRVLFALFGLRTYFPYRVVVVVLYLVAASLLLVVMRRAGVHPWIATAAASLFALFGAGWVNILRPFQITFTGALVFGLAQLILSDHEGPIDRRDVFAIGAGLLALMCSGVGVVMVAITGIAILLRRGWRIAAIHVVPLGAIYLVWLVTVGSEGGVVQSVKLSLVGNFIVTGLRAGFRTLGPTIGFGIPIVAVILIVGFVLAIRQRQPSRSELMRLAAPFALLCGAALLLATAALQGRAVTGAAYARQPRYISLVVALSLPALAVAADALTRRWRLLVPVAVVLIVLAIPHNIRVADDNDQLTPLYAAGRRVVETVARERAARKVPPLLEPNQYTAPNLTIGWLMGAMRAGAVPSAGRISRREHESAEFRLAFYEDDAKKPEKIGCATLDKPMLIGLQTGDVLYRTGGPLFLIPATPTYLYPGLMFGLYEKSTFDATEASAIHVLQKVGNVRLRAWQPDDPPRICIRSRMRTG